MTQTDAMQPKDTNTALQSVDDLIADAGRGTETITKDDVRPPALKLAQAGTPQRKPDDPLQIPGLNELDMFNTLSNQNYGRQLNVIVIMTLGRKWIQFDKDLNVVKRDIPEGDPLTEWTEDAEGNRVKPAATLFYDYLLFLPETGEIVVFSFKSTQIKVAIKLNGMLKLPLKVGDRLIPNPPAWARTFRLETKVERDASYSWGGYNLNTVGITPPELRAVISALAADYSKKKIDVDATRDTPEAEVTEGAAVAGTAQPGDAHDM